MGESLVTSEQSSTPGGTPADIFATTHWTVVLAAGRSRSAPEADRALEELCRTYSYPR